MTRSARTIKLGVAALLALLALAGGAFAYFTYTDSSNANPAQATADSLATGQTPLTPSTSPNPNSNTVKVSFTQASTTAGVAIPAGNYNVTRYPAGGGAGVSVTASCSGAGTIVCTESNVPDGNWQYTDTPAYGENWLGTESGKSSTVTVDTTAPNVSVSYPVNGSTYGGNWSGSISGTASDATSGVASTAVSIENTTTSKWWDGSGFDATSQTFVKATGTTSWSYAIGASKLNNGDSYSVVGQATDAVGNSGTSSAAIFNFVSTAPSDAVSYPSNNVTYDGDWSGTISGSASSNAGSGTSVSSTAISIEDTTTSKWWDGTGFNSGSQTFVAATGTSSWSYALASSAMTTGHSYAVQAQATDSLGNVGSSSTVSFTYNTNHPVVSISYPTTSTTYGPDWTGSIAGTATAQAGNATITGTTLAIEDTTTGKWYDGSGFNNTSSTQLNATGTSIWTYALAAGKLTSGHSYAIVAQTTDSAGNVGSSSTVTFTYNTSAPSVAITYPAGGSTYGSSNWAGSVTGSASSNAGSGTTISGTTVTIEDTTATKWWDGSGFNSTPTSVNASGTTNWSTTLPASALTSGDSYSVSAQTTDSAGNSATSSPATTFTYAPVTATLVTEASNATGPGKTNTTLATPAFKSQSNVTYFIAVYCQGGTSNCGSNKASVLTGSGTPFAATPAPSTVISEPVGGSSGSDCIEIVAATGNGNTTAAPATATVGSSGGSPEIMEVVQLSTSTVDTLGTNATGSSSSATATFTSSSAGEIAAVATHDTTGTTTVSTITPSSMTPLSTSPSSYIHNTVAGANLGLYWSSSTQSTTFGLSANTMWGVAAASVG